MQKHSSFSKSETARNPIAPFDQALVDATRIDDGDVAGTLGLLAKLAPPAGPKPLLGIIATMDLTTLSGDDTPERVKALCAKAIQPLSDDVLDSYGCIGLTTAAVCVYHALIGTALEALAGTHIPVAAVSAGFPHGLSPLKARVLEVEESVAAGATEIDIVINRSKALTGDWRGVYDEVRAFREACGDAHMKSIIATGDLGSLTNVAKASLVCMMAGSDFVKTSTGKEPVNATPEFALVMTRMVGLWHKTTGYKVGFKAAGGISKAKDALFYRTIVKSVLGDEWLSPHLFRFGASSLLGDVVQQLNGA